MKRIVTLLFAAALTSVGLHCQTVTGLLSFDGLFDNREYKDDMLPQTINGMRLTPLVAVSKDGHSLTGGISQVWEFGAVQQPSPCPVLFYSHNGEKWNSFFGYIPRTRLQRQLPDCFLYDSIAFFEPTIGGTMFQYSGNAFETELYLNWFSRQTETRREAFRIVSDGYAGNDGHAIGAGWFMALTHYAKPKQRGHYIYEQFQANPYLQAGGSIASAIDIEARGGVLANLVRCRKEECWHFPIGFLGSVDATWKRLEWSTTVYVGKSQAQFLSDPEAGIAFHRSDPFYNHSLYCRSGLAVTLIKDNMVDFSFSWDVSHTSGTPIHNRQMFRLSYNLDHNWK